MGFLRTVFMFPGSYVWQFYTLLTHINPPVVFGLDPHHIKQIWDPIICWEAGEQRTLGTWYDPDFFILNFKGMLSVYRNEKWKES